jgi:4-amino-4-deoxy-L-arabinose transferase-like glycosyltransferase
VGGGARRALMPAPTTVRTALVVILLVAACTRLAGAWSGTPCVVTDQPEEAAAATAEGECVSYNDSVTYLTDARLNADGDWFTTREGGDEPVATALHAPGFALLLTPLIWVGVDTYDGLRFAVALLGTAGVAMVFLLARRVGGERAGLLAAGIAAVHPLLWINDVVLMPEGLFTVAVCGIGLLAYRFHDDLRLANAAWLGAAIGAATLWRNEALSAVAFVLVPLVLGHPRLAWGDRAARLGVAVGAVALVLAPWVAFNASRFDRVALTNGVGAGLRVGTCDETFYNDTLLGLRSVDCLEADGEELRDPANDTEVGRSRVFQEGALEHYRENLGRAPVVVLARIGRFWGAWRPFESVRLDDAIEQRGAQRSQVGVVVAWALLPAAAYGALVLWRRRVPLSPLLGWVATSTLLAAANQPLQRFRIGGDVAIVVLAAVGILALARLPAVRRLLGMDALDDDAPSGAPVEV